MADYPALPFWTDAYIADTQHLTNEEHGVYLRLLMFSWRTPDCCLPNDERRLAIMVGMSASQWKRIRGTILEFFEVSDGVLTQKKLKNVRAFVQKKNEDNRERINSYWEAKRLKSNEAGDTNVYSTEEPTNIPQPFHPNPNPNPKEKEDNTPPSVSVTGAGSAAVSDEFYARLLRAVGHNPAGRVPRYWTKKMVEPYIAEWLKSLTLEEIIQIAADSRRGNPEPPNGPKALDAVMAGGVKPEDKPTSDAEILAYHGKAINGSGHLPQNFINNTLRAKLIASGTVTEARLKERGL